MSDYVLRSKAVRTHAAEPSLYFICNANTAGRAYVLKGGSEVAVGRHDLATAARQRLRKERGDALAARAHALDRMLHMGGVLLTNRSAISAMMSAVPVRQRHNLHMLRPPRAARSIELVRAQLDQRRGVSMVRAIDDDDIARVRVRPRQPQRQLVRLAARADEETHAQRFRQRCSQPLSVRGQVVVQVARVRVQHVGLPAQSIDHARMRVPHVRDVVHRIEVRLTFLIVEELLPAPLDDEWTAVSDA
jgi:hypothetical protein